MNFGSALEALKSGAQVYRLGWNGNTCITLNETALYAGSKSDLPINFTRVWYPSHADLMSCDWELV